MKIKTNDFITSAINKAVNNAIDSYDWTLPTKLSFPRGGDRQEYENACISWGMERYDDIVSNVIMQLDGEFDISDENVISDINTIVEQAIQNVVFNNMTDMFCIEKVTIVKEKCFVIARSPQEALECFKRCSEGDNPDLKPIFYEERMEMPAMARSMNEREMAMSCEVLDLYAKKQELD